MCICVCSVQGPHLECHVLTDHLHPYPALSQRPSIYLGSSVRNLNQPAQAPYSLPPCSSNASKSLQPAGATLGLRQNTGSRILNVNHKLQLRSQQCMSSRTPKQILHRQMMDEFSTGCLTGHKTSLGALDAGVPAGQARPSRTAGLVSSSNPMEGIKKLHPPENKVIHPRGCNRDARRNRYILRFH